jgi:hypothetical protein
MEHRWGERFAVCLTVELASSSSPPVTGTLENVSVSGAFVRTAQRGPQRGPVAVLFREEASVRTVRIAAYVVRESADGVGIEWCEFAPRAVRELMIPNGSDTARARRARTARRPPLEPNSVVPPRVPPGAEPAAVRTRT